MNGPSDGHRGTGFLRKRNPVARGRAYIFCVVSLAVFLVGILVRRPPITSHVAEVLIRHSATGDPGLVQKRFAMDPSSQLLAPSLLAGLSLPAASTTDRIGGTAGPSASGAPERNLQVHVQPDPESPDTARILSVRVRGASPDVTIEFLQRLSERFVAASEQGAGASPIDPRRQDLEAILRFWTNRTQSLEKELAEVSRRTSTGLPSGPPAVPPQAASDSPGLSASPLAPASGPGSRPSTVVHIPNPGWEAARKQVAESELNLARLQQTYTDAHPLVIEARRVLEGMKAALPETPRYLADEPEDNPYVQATSPGEPVEGASDHASLADADSRLDPAVASLQTSLEESHTREANYRAQLDALNARPVEPIESMAVIQPARIVGTLRDPLNARYLWGLMLPALLAGTACSIPGVSPGWSPMLRGMADVRSALGLLIKGSLPTLNGPPLSRPRFEFLASCARWSVTGSECVLLGIVVFLVVCTLAVPGFGEQTMADPLGALNSALEQVGIYK